MRHGTISGEAKSPLRYPGGKTRALKYILPLMPNFTEFREPFVGGGSVFLAVKQRAPSGVKFWINDFNKDVANFWTFVKKEPFKMAAMAREVKASYVGRDLFEFYQENGKEDNLSRAVRFYVPFSWKNSNRSLPT